MINIIVELSKYVILTLMIIYTLLCFYLVVKKPVAGRSGFLRSQITLTFFLDFTAFLVIFLKTFDFKVVVFYAEMMLYFAVIQILESYPYSSSTPPSTTSFVFAAASSLSRSVHVCGI